MAATTWEFPTLSAVTGSVPIRPMTLEGAELSLAVPSPSWPLALSPQHQMAFPDAAQDEL